MGKEARVIEAAEAAVPPWQVETEGDVTVNLTRGEETMQVIFENNSLVHPLTYSLAGVKEIKLRNVSEALKVIADKPKYETVRRKKNQPKAITETAGEDETPVALPLPFDPIESSDRDVVKAVVGKKIVWRSSMTGEYMTGVVPPRKRVEISDKDNPGKTKFVLRTSHNIRMSTTSTGRRVLTFPAVNEQFRSCGLDQIVQVV